MEIVYTEYAEDTIRDRAIPKQFIEDALLNPDSVVEGKKGRKIAQKKVGEKLLRIVFESNPNAFMVITAYYTAAKRYVK